MNWWWRIGLGVVACGAIAITASQMDFEVAVVPLVLLIALGVSLTGLLVDSLPIPKPAFEIKEAVDHRYTGLDTKTAVNLRVLEVHVASSPPTGVLRDRLRHLAEIVIRARYDETLDSAAGREALGPELHMLLNSAPRRISPDEVDRLLSRLEKL